MHKNWHVSCFVCTTCEQPFAGDYCTISGKPYCKQVTITSCEIGKPS
jgi:hypothetical protein